MNSAAEAGAIEQAALQSDHASRRLLAGFAILVALLPFAAWHFPSVADSLAGPGAITAHAVAELLYIAGALAMFGVGWYAPHGEHRLRATLVACLCLAAAVFELLHMLVYPGMPSLTGANDAATVFYFGRLGRSALPLALLALALVPRTVTLPGRLRWGLLCATLAGILPLAWYGLTHTPELRAAISDDGGALVANVRAATVALYLLAALAVASRRELERSDAEHIAFAALLGFVSEACFIPGVATIGLRDQLGFVGHIYGILAMAAAFVAVYGEAVGLHFRALAQSHAAAQIDRERTDAVFRSVAEGIVVVDNRLAVTAMNPVARHIAGCSTEIVIGLPLARALGAIHSPAVAAIVADVEAAVREARACVATDRAAVWPVRGHDVAIEHSVSPITDYAGKVEGAVLVLRDITDRWLLHEEVRDGADYARSLIEASIDPMIVVGMNGSIIDLNHAAERIAGLPRGQIVGGDFANRFAEPGLARDALRDVLPDGAVRDLALVVARPDGGRTEVSCNITPFRDATGAVRGAFAVARDVTDMRQAQLQLQFQASYDALTALPNRRMFRESIERAMVQAQRYERLAAVMLIDVDDFKDVNDSLGHAAGDDLIKAIAGRLTRYLRETDTVARIGGDEFGILVEDIALSKDIQTLANKLLDAVASPFKLEGGEVAVSCSIGVSIFPLDPGGADTLLRNADTAMYRAKEAGKNNCQYFTTDMNTAVQRRVDLGNRLRNAQKRGELSLHYQPQVRLHSGAVVGVEALLRWEAEGLGAVMPSEFIPVAEDTGLIMPIGAWVLEEACRQAARWRTEDGISVSVAVNLSARQFRDADIAATVDRVLAETGLPPALLELELTESMLMRDAPHAAATMARLKQSGVRIAIDDFGTGFSSLAYLKSFPLDYLKIDRSFVTDLPGDRNDAAIVRSIIALAHSLGLQVIAEGVETVEQMAFLHELDCDEIQGYYISRPRPAAETLDFLRQEALGAVSDGGKGAQTREGFLSRCISTAA